MPLWMAVIGMIAAIAGFIASHDIYRNVMVITI